LFKGHGEFRCVGTITSNKYKEYIEKDPVLEKCFQQVSVKEISVDVCITILHNIKDRCEPFFGDITYSF
jgi:ATP-dependent Clp protease ATP-binding subunit ClpA